MVRRNIEKPRILLISPSQDERKFQPPGLLHLAAAIKGKAEVKILPSDASAMRVRNEAASFKPHIIGVSMHFGNEANAIGYANEAKKACMDAHVVFGGPCILVPEINERILRHSSGTATIEGEADYTFKELVEIIGTTPAGKLTDEQAKKLEEKRGTSLLHLGKFHPAKLPGDRLEEKQMNTLKLNYGLLERDNAEWMTVSTSRGCPNACIFCTKPHGNKWRAKSPRTIIQELKEIALKHPEKKVVTFADDTFALSRKRLEELVGLIRKNRLHQRFSFTMQATIPSMLTVGKVGERTPDLKLLKKLKEANWTRIEFGLENFVEKERENLGKPPHTTEEAIDLLRGTARNGMDAGAFIILGGDDTHTEDIMENGYWAAKLHKESEGRIQFSANRTL
ncbi:radical SAM protein [Candidatus Micrarchaeota archaeon]|nr:radical SAM protein [Candidatus Micrarchaeota archaeon]